MSKSAAAKDLDSLGICVSLRLPDGQNVSVSLHQFDQMSKLYTVATRETAAKESLVRIKFTGKVLKKSQSVNSLGLMSGMVLKVEVGFLPFLFLFTSVFICFA